MCGNRQKSERTTKAIYSSWALVFYIESISWVSQQLEVKLLYLFLWSGKQDGKLLWLPLSHLMHFSVFHLKPGCTMVMVSAEDIKDLSS